MKPRKKEIAGKLCWEKDCRWWSPYSTYRYCEKDSTSSTWDPHALECKLSTQVYLQILQRASEKLQISSSTHNVKSQTYLPIRGRRGCRSWENTRSGLWTILKKKWHSQTNLTANQFSYLTISNDWQIKAKLLQLIIDKHNTKLKLDTLIVRQLATFQLKLTLFLTVSDQEWRRGALN